MKVKHNWQRIWPVKHDVLWMFKTGRSFHRWRHRVLLQKTGRHNRPCVGSGCWYGANVDTSYQERPYHRWNWLIAWNARTVQNQFKKHECTASLYEQDLTSGTLPHRYEAIIMPAGSFCLLPRQQIRQVLKTFHDHLLNGGFILMDLEMPLSFREGAVKTRSISISEDAEIILTSYSDKIDWLEQKTSSINRYELIERGRVVQTEVSDFTIHWYGIHEMEMLLSLAGFTNITYELGYGKQRSEVITFSAFRIDGPIPKNTSILSNWKHNSLNLQSYKKPTQFPILELSNTWDFLFNKYNVAHLVLIGIPKSSVIELLSVLFNGAETQISEDCYLKINANLKRGIQSIAVRFATRLEDV